MIKIELNKIISERKTVFHGMRFRPTILKLLSDLAKKEKISPAAKVERYILEEYEKITDKKE